MNGEQPDLPRRSDIQGLRAVAVGLVIGYHFSPALVPGGFVGVDVFFVISGYLITGLLAREVERSGRISLLSFYGRRVRRILPAALTVTLVTLIVASFAYPRLAFLEVARDASWATAYLANVHLADDPVGYFANATPSVFTHFWSLAVEEQFYLIWPVLLLLVVLLARKAWRRWSLIVIGSVLVVSLTLSVVLTQVLPTLAFYSLATRAWELAIGAGLAVAARVVTTAPPRWSAEVAGALGVGAILAAAILFSEFTPFPGYAAILPTIGTALILWAGARSPTGVGWFLSLWPARRVGDISYSLYLWHWPVLIFGFPNIDASPIARLGLLALVFALAIASYLLIERPAGRIRVVPGSRKVLLGGLSATAALVLGTALVVAISPTTGGPSVAAPAVRPTSAVITDGLIVVHPERTVFTPAAVPANVTPSLADVDSDLAEVFRTECFGLQLKVCEGGDDDGSVRVVLVGDSQAGHWWPGLEAAALENGWKAYLVGMGGCPLAEGVGNPRPNVPAEMMTACEAWQREAPEAIAALRPDVILYASHVADFTGGQDIAPETAERWRDGVAASLERITRTGASVVYFDEFPSLQHDPATCMFDNLDDVDACSTPRAWAVPASVSDLSRELAQENGAVFFSPADILCSDACGTLDGNHVIYRDADHLTASYSTLLAPVIAAIVAEMLTSG